VGGRGEGINKVNKWGGVGEGESTKISFNVWERKKENGIVGEGLFEYFKK